MGNLLLILRVHNLNVTQWNVGSLSIIGTLYGVTASIFVPLNAIYTKKTLLSVHQSVWLLGTKISFKYFKYNWRNIIN